MRIATWSAVLALASAGCLVKESTYKKALAEDARLQQELAASQKKQAETEATLGDKIKELEAQLGTLDATTKSKESELGKVRGEKEATEKELAELRRQKEAAEKRIAAYKALQDKF